MKAYTARVEERHEWKMRVTDAVKETLQCLRLVDFDDQLVQHGLLLINC